MRSNDDHYDNYVEHLAWDDSFRDDPAGLLDTSSNDKPELGQYEENLRLGGYPLPALTPTDVPYDREKFIDDAKKAGLLSPEFQDTPTSADIIGPGRAKLREVNDVLQFENDIEAKFSECQELLLSRHRDYGPKNISNAPGGPMNGLRVRMHDKISRVNNLIDSGRPPEDESIRDNLKDLANYSIIALMVLDGRWPE
jgi:hypothetical protein